MRLDIAIKHRPKGYNTKVWSALCEEAIRDKEWAFATVKDAEWTNNASTSSLVMLGEYLSQSVTAMAKASYDYLKMRAFGETFLGALDSPARERWEQLSGRKVPRTQMWKYDHTINVTSAKQSGKGWVDFAGRPVKKAV
jgi:hypothetical protein